jgi:hypothetical protein
MMSNPHKSLISYIPFFRHEVSRIQRLQCLKASAKGHKITASKRARPHHSGVKYCVSQSK